LCIEIADDQVTFVITLLKNNTLNDINLNR
jgi:hypothetical protein